MPQKGTAGASLGGRIIHTRKRPTRQKNTGVCPKCGSVKGEPCKNRYGYPVDHLHTKPKRDGKPKPEPKRKPKPEPAHPPSAERQEEARQDRPAAGRAWSPSREQWTRK